MKPTSVMIGPYNFEIEYVSKEKLADGRSRQHDGGRLMTAALKIQVSGDTALGHQKVTVLHEIAHAIQLVVNEGGDWGEKFTEEEWVARTIPMLLAVLRDNPAVSNWLLEQN
jgi:hypothetical protein